MIKLEQRQELILQFPCFANFTKTESLDLAKLMDEIHFQAGDIIVRESMPVDSIYLIVEGTAEVLHEIIINNNNKNFQLIAVLRSGESIGLTEFGFFSKTGLRTATVKATSNITLLRLSIAHLNQFLQHHPKLNETMAEAAQKMLRLQFIKNAAPFAELSHDQIQWIAKHLEERTYHTGDVIFYEGEIGDTCYLICKGKIDIFITDEEGKEHSLALLGKHELFGESALLSATLRNAGARAVEECTLLVMHKNDFLELLYHEEDTKNKIIGIMLKHGRPIANKNIIVSQHQIAGGEILITLKNPEKSTYYQLSQEGWFVYQELNGKKTVYDITVDFNKRFNLNTPDFIYELIVELVKGGFAIYHELKKNKPSCISVISYDEDGFNETNGMRFEDCFPITKETDVTWVNIEGLQNLELINQIAGHYNLHSLTIGDILNTEQRAKVEEFENYVFITLKALSWNKEHFKLSVEQVSLILGKNFVLSFHESENTSFAATIKDYLHTKQGRRMRKHKADYLLYRLIDTIVDQYFAVLEDMGEQIEKIEELILSTPNPQNARHLYSFKRKMLILRKIIWPVREAISHLMQIEGELVTRFTKLYLRDLYDHVAQSIDTIETFRDMLSGMLDVYLSSLTNRMNEIMKVLTIISTIFIPITFIASIYGMNFKNMPELKSTLGYPITLGVMFIIIVGMLIFFRRKKWI